MRFYADGIETVTQSEKGAWLTVHRIGSMEPWLSKNGQPVRLKLLGPDSKRYRAISTQIRQQAAQASVNLNDAEAMHAQALDLLSACTLDWENVIGEDGEPVPFSTDAARSFYEQIPEARDQADVFMTRRGNYLRPL